MKWLILNDINIEKNSAFFYLILVAGERILKIDLSIDFLNIVFYFYSIIIILYNDFGNNSVYFYTLLPRKRYFLICQKNMTFLIIASFFNIINGVFSFKTFQEIIEMELRCLVIGSLLLLLFCHFRVAYTESILQMITYILYAVLFVGLDYIRQIEINNIMFIFIFAVINMVNIILYRKKDFYAFYN